MSSPKDHELLRRNNSMGSNNSLNGKNRNLNGSNNSLNGKNRSLTGSNNSLNGKSRNSPKDKVKVFGDDGYLNKRESCRFDR